MSFTPGPWVVKERPSGPSVETEMGTTVATCWRFNRGVEDSTPMEDSNAHLIAAAPDLLEAVKELTWAFESYEWHSDMPGDEFHAMLNAATELVRKAEGIA